MGVTAQELAASSVTNPALNALAITAADADLADFTRGIYVGTGGDLAVVMAGEDLATETVVVFKNVASGSILPIRVRQIRTTLTTATDIIALF
jgi:hypothetical protein